MIKADGWVLLQVGHKLEIHNVLLGACVSVTMDVYVIPYVNYAKFALVHYVNYAKFALVHNVSQQISTVRIRTNCSTLV